MIALGLRVGGGLHGGANCVLVCMMSAVKSTDLIKQLKADGWYLVHVVGSHQQFKHPVKLGKVDGFRTPRRICRCPRRVVFRNKPACEGLVFSNSGMSLERPEIDDAQWVDRL